MRKKGKQSSNSMADPKTNPKKLWQTLMKLDYPNNYQTVRINVTA